MISTLWINFFIILFVQLQVDKLIEFLLSWTKQFTILSAFLFRLWLINTVSDFTALNTGINALNAPPTTWMVGYIFATLTFWIRMAFIRFVRTITFSTVLITSLFTLIYFKFLLHFFGTLHHHTSLCARQILVGTDCDIIAAILSMFTFWLAIFQVVLFRTKFRQLLVELLQFSHSLHDFFQKTFWFLLFMLLLKLNIITALLLGGHNW